MLRIRGRIRRIEVPYAEVESSASPALRHWTALHEAVCAAMAGFQEPRALMKVGLDRQRACLVMEGVHLLCAWPCLFEVSEKVYYAQQQRFLEGK